MIGATSSGRRFGGLARYLKSGHSGHELDRVAWSAGRNLPTDDPEIAAQLMQATADANPRVQKPSYHLSLSFDPTDQVDRQKMEMAADRVLNALGLAEHQAVIVAHKDRDHAHVHIMVNRVHPDTGVAWERWQDRPKIEQELRAIERDLGLRQVPGRLHREQGIEPPDRSRHTAGELRVQDRSGVIPFVDRVREHQADLRAARSWSELDDRLQAHGLRLEPKGQGLVITDGTDHMKASRLARDFSVNRLEEKFETPYPGFGPRAPGRDVDPAVRSLVRDVRRHDEIVRHRDAVDQAQEAANRAERAYYNARHVAENWTRSLDDIGSRLRDVYVDPAAARNALLAQLRTDGLARTTETLRQHPEAFGALQGVERKAAFGLITVLDTWQAQQTVERLVDPVRYAHDQEVRLREHFGITDPAPSRAAVDRAIADAGTAHAQARTVVDELRTAGEKLPALASVDRAIGDLASALDPRELRSLRLYLTDPQALVVSQLRGTAMDLVLGRSRGLGIDR
jgi:hypothetical protein